MLSTCVRDNILGEQLSLPRAFYLPKALPASTGSGCLYFGEGLLPPQNTLVRAAGYGVVTVAVFDQSDWVVSLKASTR